MPMICSICLIYLMIYSPVQVMPLQETHLMKNFQRIWFAFGCPLLFMGTNCTEHLTRFLIVVYICFLNFAYVFIILNSEPKHLWGTGLTSGEHRLKWKSLSRKEVDGTYPTRWFRLDSNPRYVEEPYKERMQFWDDLFEEYFTPVLTKISAAPAKPKTEL